MLYHGASSSQYIKRENYDLPVYATPPAYDVGVARRPSLFADGLGLEYRPACSFYSADFSVSSSRSPGSSGASTMPQKRPAPSDANSNSTPAKHIKAEHPEEFSNAVKKRLQSSTRTGQACDRCKVLHTRSGTTPACSS
jgi:hypothetical protein